MRIVTSIIAAGLLAVTPAWAQQAAAVSGEPNPASPDYHELSLAIAQKGTIYRSIKVSKSETRDGNAEHSTLDTRYRNDFTAIEGGYAVNKTLISLSITLPDGQTITDKSASPEAAMMRSMIGGFTEMAYQSDESLSPVRIENWPALRDKARNAILQAFKTSGEEVPPDAEAAVSQLFDSVLGKLNPEQAAQLYLASDRLASIPHNTGLELNKPVVNEGIVNIPLGNYPMAMRNRLTLTEWNLTGNSAHLTYSFSPAPEAFKTFIVDFMPRFLKQIGMPDSDVKAMQAELTKDPKSTFDLSTQCEYDVAIDTGLVRKGVCTDKSFISLMGQTMAKNATYTFSESFEP